MVRGCRPADNWPTEGALSYRDVWMRYRPELPAVLKGVSFDIAAGEKIGICGRTGSGKSSLIVALFRIVEPYKVPAGPHLLRFWLLVRSSGYWSEVTAPSGSPHHRNSSFGRAASNFHDMQGAILMDGVDLLTLGLKEVRSRIAAIPQVRPCLGRAHIVMPRIHTAMLLAVLGLRCCSAAAWQRLTGWVVWPIDTCASLQELIWHINTRFMFS